MITHAEKMYKDGKEFLVVIWDDEKGKLRQEIFEIRKVREKDFFGISAKECLMDGKQFIDIEKQSFNPSNGPAE